MLVDALEILKGEDIEIKQDYCLGGCCQGVIVKPFGSPQRQTIKGTLVNEFDAVAAAETLLRELDGLNLDALEKLMAKIKAGERALHDSEPPEVCQNCGVALQLYRRNCAKCGKYPY
jgi:hypothetical protein